MRCSSLIAACTGLAGLANGLNVLITNDDGFGTTNIREFYKQMTSLGHNCYIVASVTDQSTVGGRIEFTTSSKLLHDGEWGLVKTGAPSLGTDPNDSHIWYYNGTPATQVLVALDYVLPTFGSFKVPDLVIAGPNFGFTFGPFLPNIPAPIGAAYAAIGRGIPAVVFSSGNDVPVPYYLANASTPAGLQDPATITGRLAASFVQAMIAKAGSSPLLPQGYGISVNFPYITSYTSNQCTNPPFVFATMPENVTTGMVVYNGKTGLFSQGATTQSDRNKCRNPDDPFCVPECVPHESDPPCKVIERAVLGSGCKTSVTVFALDNRVCVNSTDLTVLVPLIVQSGSTPLVPGLGANASVGGNHTDPPISNNPPPLVIPSMGIKMQLSITVVALGLGVAAYVL